VRSENCSGDVHDEYAVPSRAHSNVRAAAGVRLSLPPNSNVATVSADDESGAEVILVSGGEVSVPSSTDHS
jgi:hypothetical protein